MTTDFCNELRELERCERLSKSNESQTDWLLGTSHPCCEAAEPTRGSSPVSISTATTPPPPIVSVGAAGLPAWAAKLPEEEAVSEGLSRVDSAATPPAAQLQPPQMFTQPGESGAVLEATVVTLEVSSSSIDTDVVMASRLAPRSTVSRSSTEKRSKQRPTAKRERASAQKRRPLTNITPRGESLESSGCIPQVVASSSQKRAIILPKKSIKPPEKTPEPVISPRPVLRKNMYGMTATATSSPALVSRENSIATVPATQKDALSGGAAAVTSPRFYGRSYQSSPDVVVSSESENETGSRGPTSRSRAGEGQYMKSRRHSKPKNETTVVSPKIKAVTSDVSATAAASLSDVAVIDVIEVTGESGEPLREMPTNWNGNGGHTAFTHRCDYNMTGGTEETDILLKPRGSTSLPREGEREEAVSFSEMKRLAAEEEWKEEERRLYEEERQLQQRGREGALPHTPIKTPQTPAKEVQTPQTPPKAAISTAAPSIRTVEKSLPRLLAVSQEREYETNQYQMDEEDDNHKRTVENPQGRELLTTPSQTRGGVPTPTSTPTPVKSTPAGKPPTPKLNPLPLQLTPKTEGTSPIPATKVSLRRTSVEATSPVRTPTKATASPSPAPAATAERTRTSSTPAAEWVANSTPESQVLMDRPCPLTSPAYMNPNMKLKPKASCCIVM
ncbi:uncharacterized protein TM35_000271920 [Trypanosoma theileri]|uniref:Uncharacterized protein n=1 Tax=Trypanosoma theileri TaxID=67003 RepID=A0A1X0NPG3_9TRYP|nr:uncharacterized protein TM35_000271920 [Trypanosoma theileri]ORC86602.1 hypothetical protein TM35_000271920 [Trypanosoma theileri]